VDCKSNPDIYNDETINLMIIRKDLAYIKKDELNEEKDLLALK
jgi:hypothetical protein